MYMLRRFVAATALGSAIALILVSTLTAQTNYKVPRLPDGHPDFQGFWNNTTYTPLERPKGIDREFFTKEEVVEQMKRAAAEEAEQTEPGTVADVHYDFSQFGLDRSQSPFSLSLRTSLIVDPPDGRLPPMNAEGRKRTAARAEAAKGVGRWDSAQSNQLDDRCMFIHGGGWVLGDYPTHRRLVRDLVVESGYCAAFVNYTRTPDAVFPRQIDEIYAATRWVAEHGDTINVDSRRLAVVGNSVGGNMRRKTSGAVNHSLWKASVSPEWAISCGTSGPARSRGPKSCIGCSSSNPAHE